LREDLRAELGERKLGCGDEDVDIEGCSLSEGRERDEYYLAL
jgi:hypothetical protein